METRFRFYGCQLYSVEVLTCSMVTEVITCRMDQGVTMMMKVREMAERHLTRLAMLSASSLSCTGLLATADLISVGRADQSAFLFFIFSFCEW